MYSGLSRSPFQFVCTYRSTVINYYFGATRPCLGVYIPSSQLLKSTMKCQRHLPTLFVGTGSWVVLTAVGSNTLCSVYSLVSLHAILAVRAHSSTQIPKPRQYDRYANNYPRYNAGQIHQIKHIYPIEIPYLWGAKINNYFNTDTFYTLNFS